MPRKMVRADVRAFLDEKPGWMMLSSQGRGGFPHTVPIGYFREGDQIFMGCRDGTQKVVNIERDSRVALFIEDGSSMGELRGVLLRGKAEIVREESSRLEISRLAASQRGVPKHELPEVATPGSVFIKLSSYSITSWDYSG